MDSITTEQVAAMREWAADCEWQDDPTDLSDEEIVRGVDRHYDGGVAGFVRDARS